ncbi:MAG TPA: HD domain-containing protein [Actinocrinis sp.]|nr:HD domain-containing protein [Actinocrinis sp.]
MEKTSWARDLAEQFLAGPLPRRWNHSQGVGHKAEAIAEALGADGELLACAAWLHDIGYAPDAIATGFHPLDGARFLRDVAGVDLRLCSLVAHHSCADIEARHRGLVDELCAEFESASGLLTDALTFCDITTTPDGTPTDIDARLADIYGRYGAGHLVTESVSEAEPYFIGAVHRINRLVSAQH